MTKDDIARMAREAGFEGMTNHPALMRFANLVAEREREACEKAIEELLPDADRGDCATAIRARENT
jgi:hypothetical protein